MIDYLKSIEKLQGDLKQFTDCSTRLVEQSSLFSSNTLCNLLRVHCELMKQSYALTEEILIRVRVGQNAPSQTSNDDGFDKNSHQ